MFLLKILIISFGFQTSLTTTGNVTFSKCCLENESIFIKNSSKIECKFYNNDNNELFIANNIEDDVVNYGLIKNCKKIEISNLYDENDEIYCMDIVINEVSLNLKKLNIFAENIVGLKCTDQLLVINKTQLNRPRLNTINKCCPFNRQYSINEQNCWNKYSENKSSITKDLTKLVIKNEKSFVKVKSSQIPVCSDGLVLIDKIVDYKSISIVLGDSLLLDDDENKTHQYAPNEYCIDLIDDVYEKIIIRTCKDYDAACSATKTTTCVRKCCPVGKSLNENKSCENSKENLHLSFHNLTSTKKELAIAGIIPAYLIGHRCGNEGKYFLNPTDNKEDDYYLGIDGNILMKYSKKIIDIDSYCIEHLNSPKMAINDTLVFLCFPPKTTDDDIVFVKAIAMVACSFLSVFCLVLTLFVYLCLKSLQNFHGQLIMCYIITLIFGYSTLFLVNLVPVLTSVHLCLALGYITHFSFISSFCWLNLICHDIYSTFGTMRSTFFKSSRKSKKLIGYSFYGWGIPFIFSCITCVLQFSNILDESSQWKPDISKSTCWFDVYGLSRILFYSGPSTLMLFFNAILYFLTVHYCYSVRNELHNIQGDSVKKKFSADRNKLIMYTKLFVVMGMNWALEVISLFVGPKNRLFFLATDIINASNGVLIFFIFVLKRKLLSNLKEKICGKHDEDEGNNHRPSRTSISIFKSSAINSMQSIRSV